MNGSRFQKAAALVCMSAPVLAACSSSTATNNGPDASVPPGTDASSVVDTSGTAQMPPMGAANVEAWLAQGFYKQWKAEPAMHPGRAPTVHMFNRVFANSVVSDAVDADSGVAPWGAGASLVKEIYVAMGDTTPAGYAVTLKTAADSAAGANWYFYEKVSGNVYSDGLGTPTSACVMCHSAAGSDAAHTTTPGDHDFVYTPVP
jgi:hypothetical protein